MRAKMPRAQAEKLSDKPVEKVSRGEGIAIWRQIAEDLASEIRSGSLAPGSRLPTETQLADTYGVNRHTLRRALSELSRLGLVAASPRRGTFVTDSRIDYPIKGTTRFSENIIAAGRDPGGEVISAEETTAPPEMAEWLNIAEKAKVIQIEIIRSANDLPICYALTWLPADRFDRMPRVLERFKSMSKALSYLGVKDYRRKITRISARPANAKERANLQLERGATVLLVESLNVDLHGEPIQAGLTVFAAAHVQLTVENETLI